MDFLKINLYVDKSSQLLYKISFMKLCIVFFNLYIYIKKITEKPVFMLENCKFFFFFLPFFLLSENPKEKELMREICV